MAGVNDWRRGTVWLGSSSVKQRTLSGSLAASTISLRSMSFVSNFEIEIASVTSEFSLSPSGTRKDTAPSGAVVWDGGLVDGSGGGGPVGELGRVVL